MGRLGKPVLVDWMGQRKESKSIPDFVERLTNQINQLPRRKRAKAYADILRDIDPALEPRVQKMANLFVQDGLEPKDALRLATSTVLKSRRQFIFRLLFKDISRRHAEEIVESVMRLSSDPAERAQMFNNTMGRLRPPVRPGYSKEQARFRLEETHFPEWFIDWAINKRKPASQEDIQLQVAELMQRGVEPKEAMRQGAQFAIREFILDNMMAMGVASGPDFCIVGAVIGAVVGVAAIVVPIAIDASNRKKDREAASDAAERERARDLMPSDIQQICRSIESLDDDKLKTFNEARTLATRYAQGYRDRDTLTPSEESQIRECWQRAKTERWEAQAEQREEAWELRREDAERRRAHQRASEAEDMLSHLSEVERGLERRRAEIREQREEAIAAAEAREREIAEMAQQELRRRKLKLWMVLGGVTAAGVVGYFVLRRAV